VTILNERVVLDTNIWIFGLRHQPQAPACTSLLERLGQLHVVLPRQILKELRANFSRDELVMLFRLLKHYPNRVVLHWNKVGLDTIRKYQRLGCKPGDAAVAAHLEELEASVLVTENRHFLEQVENLPFRTINAHKALEEMQGSERR
jgi:predicted nucleic acid-binding protein